MDARGWYVANRSRLTFHAQDMETQEDCTVEVPQDVVERIYNAGASDKAMLEDRIKVLELRLAPKIKLPKLL